MTHPEQSSIDPRERQLLDAMENPYLDYGVGYLARKLGWPKGRVVYFLQSLREAGCVTYEPGYRTWSRS